MAQIQLHPGAGVKLVFGNNILLQSHTLCDHVFPMEVQPVFFQMSKQLRIIQYAVLDHFGASVTKYVVRKRIQRVNITQYQTGLVKRAGQIFAGRQINGCFTAHGGIYGRKKGCRDLNIGDTPQIGGCGKASQIADDAAAQGDQQISTGQLVFRKEI